MRIGINALILKKENTGTGFYTRSLIEELVKHDEHSFYLFVKSKDLLPFTLDLRHVKTVEMPYASKTNFHKIFAEQLILPRIIKKYNLDVLHSTSFVIPLFATNVKQVVTVHDLFHVLFKSTIKPINRIYFNLLFNHSIKKADYIISNSECTTNDIVKYLYIQKKLISTIPLGLNQHFSQNNKNSINVKLPHNYILYVGSLEPRKNIESVLKSFAEVKNDIDEELVIVGAKKWKENNLKKLVYDLGLESRTHFLGYVEDEELPTIYKKAKLFLFPSLYEGFGFPVLEAMRMKVPVITSNISSLPEVIGDSGFLIEDPYDIKTIAYTIKKVLSRDSEVLSKIENAYLRSLQFNWQTTAEKTISAYKKVLERV